jgi:hypothetical protein
LAALRCIERVLSEFRAAFGFSPKRREGVGNQHALADLQIEILLTQHRKNVAGGILISH